MKIFSFDEFDRRHYGQHINEGMFGMSPKESEEQLSADYIKEHKPEEIAKVFHESTLYYIDNAKGEIDVAIDQMNTALGDSWVAIINDQEISKKYIDGIVYAVKAAISLNFDDTKKFAASIPNSIVFGIAYMLKLTASGIDAKNATTTLCKDMLEYIKKTDGEFSDKIKNAGDNTASVISSQNDKIAMYLRCNAAIAMMTAKKLDIGDLSTWVDEVVKTAKENYVLSVGMLNGWKASKDSDIQKLVASKDSELDEKIGKTWEGVQNDVQDAYNKAADQLQDWLDNAKLNAGNITKKIPEVDEAKKEKVINIENASPIEALKTSVKSMDKGKYKLEQVVDIVTKAYNEQ